MGWITAKCGQVTEQQISEAFNLKCQKYLKQKPFFFAIKPTRCTNFTNLFCHETLHVSDSSSIHH